MANVFQRILQQAAMAKMADQKTKESIDWIRDKASKTRSVDPTKTIQQKLYDAKPQLKVGQMFLFRYNPKTKEQLPYHDMFPLIFPISRDAEGFYGINMHYLPPQYRAILMDQLYGVINNDKNDETTKLRLSYALLSKAAKFRFFRPCIKRYLNSHVQSKFIYIAPEEWNIALFLPLHKFVGASASRVYNDSKRIIAAH